MGCIFNHAIFVILDVLLWRYLSPWSAARDLWCVARREGLLQFPIKLVFNFLAFALLASLSVLRHIAPRFGAPWTRCWVGARRKLFSISDDPAVPPAIVLGATLAPR